MAYLRFLTTLKNKLPNKSLSIAAPASYWYLKAFPIDRIAAVVDYIVYMCVENWRLAMTLEVLLTLETIGHTICTGNGTTVTPMPLTDATLANASEATVRHGNIIRPIMTDR